MKSLSSKTYQGGVSIQGLTTLSGTVYLTGITNTASWDHVIVGTTAQGQIYTRTYAQFMGDVATGISLSSYVTGSGTTNYLPKFTGASALGNSQIFDNGTNVGIGTSNPAKKLHVVGDAWINRPTNKVDNNGATEFGSRVEFNNAFTAGSTGYTVFNYPSAAVFRIYADYDGNVGGVQPDLQLGLGYLTVKNSGGTIGNIGIGTTTPAYKLQVGGGDIAIDYNRYLRGGSGGDWNLVNLYNGGTGDIEITMLNVGWYLRHNANATFAGNIGIGTTNPSTKLHVVGASIIANNSSINPDTYGSTVIAGAIGTVGGWGLSSAIGGNAGTGHSWAIGTNGDNLYMGYSNGSSSNSMLTFLQVDDSTRNVFLVPSAGNVGIGTASPSYKLDVNGSFNAVTSGVYLTYSSGILYHGNYYQFTSGNNYLLFARDSGDLILGSNDTERLRITSAGNVGIGTASPNTQLHVSAGNFLISGTAIGGGADANSGLRIVAPISTTHYNWMLGAQQNINSAFEITPSTTVGGTTFSTPTAVFLQNGNVGIGTTSPATKLDVSGVITATGGNSTNWNTAYGWGNHASASYVPQARTLTINGTSYDLSANRTWTIPTSANIQEAANNGKVTTAASVGTTVITTVATATYDGATFNYVLKDGTNYRAGTIIAVWSAGAVQFNETTTNDIGSTVGVTFAVALNAGNAELRATSATPGWTVKVVTIGI
jgi:hypothetical protein